jgi:hypothetical protein
LRKTPSPFVELVFGLYFENCSSEQEASLSELGQVLHNKLKRSHSSRWSKVSLVKNASLISLALSILPFSAFAFSYSVKLKTNLKWKPMVPNIVSASYELNDPALTQMLIIEQKAKEAASMTETKKQNFAQKYIQGIRLIGTKRNYKAFQTKLIQEKKSKNHIEIFFSTDYTNSEGQRIFSHERHLLSPKHILKVSLFQNKTEAVKNFTEQQAVDILNQVLVKNE